MSEVPLKLSSGYVALLLVILALCLIVAAFVGGIMMAKPDAHDRVHGFSHDRVSEDRAAAPWIITGSVVAFLFWLAALFGFVVVNPNDGVVVQLFGEYVGTIKETGFYYGNPLYKKRRVSLRIHTFETGQTDKAEVKDAMGKVIQAGERHRQPSKVNDKDGTPIEVAAVVVWQVVNTADAIFRVDDYEDFIHVQSEAALRNLASQYSYDSHEDHVHSLRSHATEVGERLKRELEERLKQAGVHVLEARISTLAYAPEIAAAMLQRQQAGAIIAARQKIVEGAVGMVEMALDLLAQKQVVELDSERRAAMVSNLLVVLCGDRSPQPVLNTGTIHQ